MAMTFALRHPVGLFPLRRTGLPRRCRHARPPARVRAEGSSPQPDPQSAKQEPPKAPVPEWVGDAVAQYDEVLATAKEAMEQQRKEVQKMDDAIAELELSMAPRWVLGFLGSMRNFLQWLLDTLTERANKMEAGREKFVAEVMEIAVQEREPAPSGGGQSFLDDLTEDQRKVLENPNTLATSYIFQFLFAATLVSGLGWVLGVDSGRQLVLPGGGDWEAGLAQWAMWTAPYVGGTLLAGSLAPGIALRRVLRGTASNQRFFSEVGLTSILTLSVAAAGAQALAYQGVWMDFALNFFRGPAASVPSDPALLEEMLRSSYGSLVAAPGFNIFAAPLSVLSVAALEAGWYSIVTKADALAPGLQESEDLDALLGPQAGDGFLTIHKRFLDDQPVQDPELLLLAGRVFTSSTYLSCETLLGGSLWLAIGTSAAGIMTSLLLARQRGREARGGR